jgi:pyruvate formate lyase activating enzyme
MIHCLSCCATNTAASLGLCASCIRKYPECDRLLSLHGPSRRRAGLPEMPPKDPDGIACSLCANGCAMGPGKKGYCGLRENNGGRLREKAPTRSALLHFYLDRLPTNCCAAWFCRGSREDGFNLAVFFYGCGFDCFFCQNASHKCISEAPVITVDELVKEALHPRVRCVCFFGGSPEPQLPYALEAAERILEESGGGKHICWEWNGSGNEALVERAARLSLLSGGTVKFDLKAFHPNLGNALCGVDITPAFRNFRMLAGKYPGRDLLTATTLLVSGYVEEEEVSGIAAFLAGIDTDIPYSLLVFHPDHLLDDLPVTPKKQVYRCFDAARSYLTRVEIGNRGLIPRGD